MPDHPEVSHLRLGVQGRAVIPARARKALGLQPGDELLVWVEGDRLILRSRRALVQEMLGAYRHVAPRSSLVDRLIEARRAEVWAGGGA